MIRALVLAALSITVGCGYNELGPNKCTNAPGAAHAVTCPGVPGCVCADPDVCCLAAIDATVGACASPRNCTGITLTCDGPEDCAGGICCLTKSGSSCTAANACQGTWLCRTNAQCAGSGASQCVPADYGQPGVRDRGLDGQIGMCRS